MLKGVNKLIVEINNPESDYFERAIFFVKPNKGNVSTFELTDNAGYLIKSAAGEVAGRKKKRAKAVFKLIFAACLGALAAVTIFILL